MNLAILTATIAILGCHPTAPTTVSNAPTPPTTPTNRPGLAEEVKALESLAKALADDDGPALAKLVHSRGTMFWYQHAELIPPAISIDADQRPSEKFEALRGSKWPATYAADVAAAIRRGLQKLVIAPNDHPDRCEDRGTLGGRMERGGTYLLELEHLGDSIADQFISDIEATSRFRTWGLEVYSTVEGGRVSIVHVIVWDPCRVLPRVKMPQPPSP